MGRDGFEHLIPHAGRMCLLDRVEHWDDDSLCAYADSHRSADHPLATADGRLAAIHALEYGAQAMAVHGGLLAARDGAGLPKGFLAGGRQLRFHVARLDTLDGELRIEVERRFAQAGNLIFDFRITAGEVAVADGTATVMAVE